MLRLSEAAEESLRTGLDATQMAIGGLVQACAMVREAAPPEAQPQLDLAIRRLRAVRGDLRSRAVQPGADSLYVGLAVTGAALAGLAESLAATREGLRHLMPAQRPAEGWFVDEDGGGA